jgi:hypothetical protein
MPVESIAQIAFMTRGDVASTRRSGILFLWLFSRMHRHVCGGITDTPATTASRLLTHTRASLRDRCLAQGEDPRDETGLDERVEPLALRAAGH